MEPTSLCYSLKCYIACTLLAGKHANNNYKNLLIDQEIFGESVVLLEKFHSLCKHSVGRH